MRLFGTVDGRPAILVGYGPGKGGLPVAIVIGLGDCPTAVPLNEFRLPKLPKKLQRRINTYIRRETREAQTTLAAHGQLDA